jgi:hypothetical protein
MVQQTNPLTPTAEIWSKFKQDMLNAMYPVEIPPDFIRTVERYFKVRDDGETVLVFLWYKDEILNDLAEHIKPKFREFLKSYGLD